MESVRESKANIKDFIQYGFLSCVKIKAAVLICPPIAIKTFEIQTKTNCMHSWFETSINK